MTKPREYWIFRNDVIEGAPDRVLFEEPFGTGSSDYTHVIDKKSYDEVIEALKIYSCEHKANWEGLRCCHANRVLKEVGEK